MVSVHSDVQYIVRELTLTASSFLYVRMKPIEKITLPSSSILKFPSKKISECLS